MRARRAAALVGALVLAAAAPAAGEVARIALEGAVPVAADATHSAALREAALDDAVARAVDRVAQDLAAGDDRLAEPLSQETLDGLFGADRRDYTERFRIAEVEGVRAPEVLGLDAAEAEYAVAAEVWVDVDRVRARLEQAGLLAAAAPTGAARTLVVVLEPLESYAAYAFVRDQLGATPRELTRGRAVLAVETPLDPDQLAARLRREAPPGMRVEAWRDGDGLRLHVISEPAAPGD